MPAKQPQDHRPKKKAAPAEEEPYTFEWEGTTYTLPSPEGAIDKISGRMLRDAYMDGDEGQMRLGFTMLEKSDVDPAALDALYDMPAPAMLDHVGTWMETRSSGRGATMGESSRSPS
jgi:hypothetical protein